jgi:hypothetical protein
VQAQIKSAQRQIKQQQKTVHINSNKTRNKQKTNMVGKSKSIWKKPYNPKTDT